MQAPEVLIQTDTFRLVYAIVPHSLYNLMPFGSDFIHSADSGRSGSLLVIFLRTGSMGAPDSCQSVKHFFFKQLSLKFQDAANTGKDESFLTYSSFHP
jgi:hypothetical protein